ncbi:hypothetical protein QJS66_03105 [Kocuria rhizophila]|nr:hypothetical protein QJS66_03105 [Kocuria rhizophila]
MGLADRAHHSVFDLSGGERQLVALAAVLAVTPRAGPGRAHHPAGPAQPLLRLRGAARRLPGSSSSAPTTWSWRPPPARGGGPRCGHHRQGPPGGGHPPLPRVVRDRMPGGSRVSPCPAECRAVRRPRRVSGTAARRDDLLGTYVPGTSWLHRCPLGLKAALVLGSCLAVTLLVLVAGVPDRAGPHRPDLRHDRSGDARLGGVPAPCGSWYAPDRLPRAGHGSARAAEVVVPAGGRDPHPPAARPPRSCPADDGLVRLCSPLRRVGVDPGASGWRSPFMIRSVPWLFGVMSTLRDAAAAHRAPRTRFSW